jgi:hypothetical protein
MRHGVNNLRGDEWASHRIAHERRTPSSDSNARSAGMSLSSRPRVSNRALICGAVAATLESTLTRTGWRTPLRKSGGRWKRCPPRSLSKSTQPSPDDHAHATQDRHVRPSLPTESNRRLLPPGNYVVVTEEDLIEGLSFPAYRRVSTGIMVPAQNRPSSVEMLTIDPSDLGAARERDATRVICACQKQNRPLREYEGRNVDRWRRGRAAAARKLLPIHCAS